MQEKFHVETAFSARAPVTRAMIGGLTGLIVAGVLWLGPPAAAAPRQDVEQLVESTAALVRDQFVDESTARRTADEILKRLAKGDYDTLVGSEEIQRRLTDDLRAISGDTHIGVVFDPQSVSRYRARALAEVSASAKQRDQEAEAASAEEAKADNYGIYALETLPGGVGYLRLDSFDKHIEQGEAAFAAAMDFLSPSQVIIVDLRRNGGGSSRSLPDLLGYFLGPEPVRFATRRERWRDLSEQLYTRADLKGARQYDKPLIILTSGTTYSLAEHFTYHLRSLRQVILVGERTYGGGNGWDPVVLNDDYYLRLPRVAFANAKSGAIFVEGEGIAPDIEVAAAQAKDRGYVEALSLRLTQDVSADERQQIIWAQPIAEARLSPPVDTRSDWRRFEGRFAEYRFELRPDGLYLSFRDLPPYKLEPLGAGLFLDDRAVQQQIQFPGNDTPSVDTVRILRFGEPEREIERSM